MVDDLQVPLFLDAWLEESLLEELRDPRYAPLVDALGYEGLLDTLRAVAKDPLAAQELLRKGPEEMAEALRLKAWRGLKARLEALERSLGGERLEERYPVGWRSDEPDARWELRVWVEGVNLKRNPWRGYGEDSTFKKLLDLLRKESEWPAPRPADERMEAVWPSSRGLPRGS